uniref:Sulfotransferase domain-containing protein n=1 Tax=Ditylum brightwellii TaxID=49249 RepID=A0A7S4UNI7_9STRA
MPWLIHPESGAKIEEHLLFVHVPRCGGTSLTQHFHVPEKCQENRSLWGRIGMKWFFFRYKMFEKVNFPIYTIDNAVMFMIFLAGIAKIILAKDGDDVSVGCFMMALSCIVCAFTTFICTAPVIARRLWVRRGFFLFIHHCLFDFMASTEWITGVNMKGYMMHFTASKLLAYGLVSPEEMANVCSMAIVRNPYSRMVSVYMYNRFGSKESFNHFVKDWYKQMRYYRESKETDEWYTPCHCIPQHEYTHIEGKQIVQSIIKQEELKYLKHKEDAEGLMRQDSSVAELPDVVRKALLGMPHTNKRSSNGKTAKKWWEYYDQETLDLTFEIYKDDFEAFNYSPKIEQRPDLVSPVMSKETKLDRMMRNSIAASSLETIASMRNASIKRFSVSGNSLSKAELESLREYSLKEE